MVQWLLLLSSAPSDSNAGAGWRSLALIHPVLCSKEPCDLWGGLFHMPQFSYLYNGKKHPHPTPCAFRSDSEKSRTFAL